MSDRTSRLRHLCIALSSLTLIGIGAATVATWLARESYVFDLFTHFRPYYLIALLAGFALAAIARARLMLLLAVGLAVPHALAMTQVAHAPRVAANPAQPALRLLSFNVQYLNPRKDLVIAYLQRAKPDMILLQEVANGWQATIEQLRATHPFMVPAQPDFRGGNVTLSRHPIVDGTALPHAFGGPPIVRTRIALQGRTLTIFNVHPLHPLAPDMADSQQRQFAQVAQSRPDKDEPYVIAGDFNLTPWSPHFGDLLTATKTSLATHGRFWPSTWPANGSYGWLMQRLRGLPIDHFLVSDSIGVVDVKRGPTLGSDHYPMLLKFVLRETIVSR